MEEELNVLESILPLDDFQRGEKQNEVILRVPLDSPVLVTDLETGRAVEMQRLSHVTLKCRLNDDYPEGREPPSLDLECCWMSDKHLATLKRLLLDHWHDKREIGEVVLYQWYQLLRDRALQTLDIHDSVKIQTSIIFNIMLNEDKAARQADFWQCQICFDELQGCHFEELRDCGHVYCSSCLGSHCRAKVEAGQMANLTCPEPECDEPIPGDIVQRYKDVCQ